jgi:hypothetical protein
MIEVVKERVKMMIETTRTLQPAIQYEIEVQASGRVELPGSFTPGTRLIVFVIQTDLPTESFDDLTAASTSSTDFWNNPLDDEDWNNA